MKWALPPPVESKEAVFVEGTRLMLATSIDMAFRHRTQGQSTLRTSAESKHLRLSMGVHLTEDHCLFDPHGCQQTQIDDRCGPVHLAMITITAPASIYMPKSLPDGRCRLEICPLTLVTFFKLGINHIAATIFAEDSALSLEMPSGMNLDTSSLASRSCSSMVGLVVPLLLVDVLHRMPQQKWTSNGRLETSLSIDMYRAPTDWRDKAAEQQRFLREQDATTQRIWYMYREGVVPSGEYGIIPS